MTDLFTEYECAVSDHMILPPDWLEEQRSALEQHPNPP
jgi:hypothetical protein